MTQINSPDDLRAWLIERGIYPKYIHQNSDISRPGWGEFVCDIEGARSVNALIEKLRTDFHYTVRTNPEFRTWRFTVLFPRVR